MTDFDLDRLGDLWRQQPDPQEMERLQRSAAAVRRRARLGQFVDVAAAILVAAVVVLLVASSPNPRTVIMGAAAILVLLVSNIRLRRLRQVELRSLAGSASDMLDQSIERVENTLRYQRFTLLAIGPGLAFGYLVVRSTRRFERSLVETLSGVEGSGLIVGGAWILLFVGLTLYVIRSIRRSRRELEHLEAMRSAYRAEQDSSD